MKPFSLHPDPGPVPPRLTLPEAEAGWLRAAYAEAATVLEYGSGGSTVMAAGMADKTIFSVESDADWLAGLQRWFAIDPPRSRVVLHHGDIGPTVKWGHPEGISHWRQFHAYPTSVWDRPDFEHPDVVLVDGRFRAACFLTVLFRITRPVSLYFDDYTARPHYHRIERFAKPVETRGRMARFDLVPTPIPASDLAMILETYTDKK